MESAQVACLLGVADGVLLGLDEGVPAGGAEGVPAGVSDGVAVGVIMGVPAGVSDGVPEGVADGVLLGVGVVGVVGTLGGGGKALGKVLSLPDGGWATLNSGGLGDGLAKSSHTLNIWQVQKPRKSGSTLAPGPCQWSSTEALKQSSCREAAVKQ